jgi:hypothetical protein
LLQCSLSHPGFEEKRNELVKLNALAAEFQRLEKELELLEFLEKGS